MTDGYSSRFPFNYFVLQQLKQVALENAYQAPFLVRGPHPIRLSPETKTQKRFTVRPSRHFNIPEGSKDIYLLPAKTVSDAVIASFVGIGIKALSVFMLVPLLLIFFAVLIGLIFGLFSLAGQEENFKSAITLLLESHHLPQSGHITLDDLSGFFPLIFVGLFTGLLLPLCCDFVMFHLKRKKGREGMKDEFIRRLRRNSLLIGMAFIFEIAMTPLAKYGEETTVLSMSAGLAGLCLVALIANLFFVAFDTFANQLLWHGGLVFYKRFF